MCIMMSLLKNNDKGAQETCRADHATFSRFLLSRPSWSSSDKSCLEFFLQELKEGSGPSAYGDFGDFGVAR